MPQHVYIKFEHQPMPSVASSHITSLKLKKRIPEIIQKQEGTVNEIPVFLKNMIPKDGKEWYELIKH